MSHLGDVLVELGPITQDYLVGAGFSSDLRWVRADDLNALRDELIELRAAAALDPEPCQEETPSWRHFTHAQVGEYWIRCTLAGPHDEHEDEHTGLTWTTTEMETP